MSDYFWLLVIYGITFGVQYRFKFLQLNGRFLGILPVACCYCVGFHAGWLTYALRKLSTMELPWSPAHEISMVLSWGFAGAALSYMIAVIADWFERP